MSADTRKKTLLKTASWRLVATSIGVGLIYFYTGSMEFGLAFGVADILIKSLAYYFHERIWAC